MSFCFWPKDVRGIKNKQIRKKSVTIQSRNFDFGIGLVVENFMSKFLKIGLIFKMLNDSNSNDTSKMIT